MSSPRYWGMNIVVDGSWYARPTFAFAPKPPGGGDLVEKYQVDVQGLLRTIAEGSVVGKLLLGEINKLSRELRIIPAAFRGFEETRARPVSPEKAVVVGSSPAYCAPNVCSGGGTDVVILFEPSTWNGPATVANLDPFGDETPADVLFHEMVHAYRFMLGIGTTETMAKGFHFLEEFYAILLANIYRSETGRTVGLRADHSLPRHRLSEMPGDGIYTGAVYARNAAMYYTEYKYEIDRLCAEPRMDTVCRPLGAATYPQQVWNPIRSRTMRASMYSTP